MIRNAISTCVAGLALVSVLAPCSWGQVDYRDQQSSVKNQGGRGTCAAFSVCAAMEVFPGVPTDLSEQILYASIKLHQNNTDLWRRALGMDPTMSIGDALGSYAYLASGLGTCPEEFFPYNPNPLQLPDTVPEEVRRYIELAQVTPEDLTRLRRAVGVYRVKIAADGLLQLAAAQDIDRIKAELDAGRIVIPISYRVHEPSWTNLDETGNIDASGVRDIIHPGMMELFARKGGQWMTYNQAKAECMKTGEDLAAAVRSGEWLSKRAYPETEYGGHAVTIVGYDEIGFIVKNSWGEEWGTDGYCRIAYDYHRLYSMEALLVDGVEVDQWPSSSLKRTAEIRDGQWRLKLAPHADAERLVLSSWALGARQPDAQVVAYTVYRLVENSVWEVVAERHVLIPVQARDWGAKLVLSAEESASLREAGTGFVRVRYGYFSLDDPSQMEDAVFPAERAYGPFSLDTNGALDLLPRSGR
ncbi:MAG: C1 family peptidase [Phycisphaerales bacterium JB050]